MDSCADCYWTSDCFWLDGLGRGKRTIWSMVMDSLRLRDSSKVEFFPKHLAAMKISSHDGPPQLYCIRRPRNAALHFCRRSQPLCFLAEMITMSSLEARLSDGSRLYSR